MRARRVLHSCKAQLPSKRTSEVCTSNNLPPWIVHLQTRIIGWVPRITAFKEHDPMTKPALTASLVVAALALAVHARTARCALPEQIDVLDLTVQSVQDGLRSRRYTARQLAEACLARIALYNPGYNAIITPNPSVLREAVEVDRKRDSGAT